MTETRADKIIAAGKDGTVELEEALAAECDKLEAENAALRADARELASALNSVLQGIPVRNADELIERQQQHSQGDGYYAIVLHPDGTSTDLKKPYCRDCGSNDVSMEGKENG